MIPLIYETTSRILSLNSMHYLGRLTGCTECTVEESRNADYTLSASVVKNSECAESAVVQNYIYAKPNPADEAQFFEIYEVVEKNNVLSIKAKHIKHNCYNNILAAGETSAQLYSPAEAYENLDALFDNNYVFSSDITDRKNIKLGFTQVCTLGDFLGGAEGSLLDLFHGEYKWNNFNVSFLKSRGKKRAYRLKWGDNISSYEKTQSSETTISHVCAYATVYDEFSKQDIQIIADPYEIFEQKSKTNKLSVYPVPDNLVNGIIVNSSTGDGYEFVKNTCRIAATAYIGGDKLGEIKSNIKVDVEAVLDDMQQFNLCDTVTVILSDSIAAESKIVKTTYDTLRERYKQLELGSFKTKLSDFVK
ncbi:phage tail spike protein [Ruminococcus sp.]|uniref:phage tail spike protein n=1 Tax=Ruminococcus sp. TaxID=41978 RepID=UPI003078A9AE